MRDMPLATATGRVRDDHMVRFAAKMLWLAGVFVVFVLVVTFMIGGAMAEFGGDDWTPAYLALPAAILLIGILWATFHRVFPDRWP